MMGPSLVRLVVVVLSLVAVVGPAAGAGDPSILTVGMGSEARSMDPHFGGDSDLQRWMPNSYESLFELKPPDGSSLAPLLATKWEISSDKKLYTFTLRRGVKFSDGADFNADAVRVNIERIQKGKRGGPYEALRRVREVRVVDPYTVQLVLEQPYDLVPWLTHTFFVSPAALRANDKDGDLAADWLRDRTAGTGPYMLTSWRRGVDIVYEQNPHYWRGWKTQFKRIVIKRIHEAGSQRLLLEKGDLDWAVYVANDAVPALEKNPSVKVVKTPSFVQEQLLWNTQVAPLKDKRVRQALAHAWDWESYRQLVQGLTAPPEGPVPLGLFGPGYSIANPDRFDLDRARKLLAEAGLPNGGFTLKIWAGPVSWRRPMYELLSANLKQLGITTRLVEDTWPAMNERVRRWATSQAEGDLIHGVIYFNVALTPHPRWPLISMYHSAAHLAKPTGLANFGYYSNPEVDRLIDQAEATLDRDKAMEIWKRVNASLLDDAPAIYLHKLVFLDFLRADVGGFEAVPYKMPNYAYYYNLHRTK
jgi:ABC-type transport system substrate-binding protein